MGIWQLRKGISFLCAQCTCELNDVEAAKLCKALDQNSIATNRQLRAVVRNKIAARTVSDYLARAHPPFTTKVIQDQEPEELTEEWKEGARRWVEGVKRIRLDKRIYEDETPVYANEAPKRGRSRRGTPIIRARSRYAKKYTLHVYAKKSGVLHWELSDKNADIKEIERVWRCSDMGPFGAEWTCSESDKSALQSGGASYI